MLSRGARGDQVENVQNLLSQVGLYAGQAHGVYDAATENGVKDLQRANGLRPDGAWGPITNQRVLDVLGQFNPAPGAGDATMPNYGTGAGA